MHLFFVSWVCVSGWPVQAYTMGFLRDWLMILRLVLEANLQIDLFELHIYQA